MLIVNNRYNRSYKPHPSHNFLLRNLPISITCKDFNENSTNNSNE